MRFSSTPRHPVLGPVAAVVVTFRPDGNVTDRLTAIGAAADGVVVVDNGSGPPTVERLAAWADHPARSLIALDRNLGLAAAQNRGIAAALDAGAAWIWLFDDDSRPGPNTLPALADAEAGAPGRYDLLAPRIRNDDGSIAPLTVREGRRIRRLVPDADAIVENPVFVIASGSLIRTQTLRAVGPMREAFFIDYVDIDFCLRLARAGRRSAVVGAAVLDHRLGAPTRHRLPGGAAVTATNHSAPRRFFMTRNRARLWREQGRADPVWVVFDILAFGYQLLRIALLEQGRAGKLSAVGRGLLDGLFTAPEAWGEATKEMER